MQELYVPHSSPSCPSAAVERQPSAMGVSQRDSRVELSEAGEGPHFEGAARQPSGFLHSHSLSKASPSLELHHKRKNTKCQ